MTKNQEKAAQAAFLQRARADPKIDISVEDVAHRVLLPEQVTASLDNVVVLGVDPGVNVPAEVFDGVDSFHLTSKQVRHQSKAGESKSFMDKVEKTTRVTLKDGTHAAARAKVQREADGTETISLRDLETTMPTLKCGNFQDYLSAVDARLLYYAELWPVKAIKTRNANKFRVRRFKHSCMDTFLHNLVAPHVRKGKVPVFSYGSASFASTMRGTTYSSYQQLRKRASIHAPVVLMDEYLTSKVCACCEQRLEPVSRHKHVKRYNRDLQVREILFEKTKLHNVLRCSTKHNLLQRDPNSAKNMHNLLVHYLQQGERKLAFRRPAAAA